MWFSSCPIPPRPACCRNSLWRSTHSLGEFLCAPERGQDGMRRRRRGERAYLGEPGVGGWRRWLERLYPGSMVLVVTCPAPRSIQAIMQGPFFPLTVSSGQKSLNSVSPEPFQEASLALSVFLRPDTESETQQGLTPSWKWVRGCCHLVETLQAPQNSFISSDPTQHKAFSYLKSD